MKSSLLFAVTLSLSRYSAPLFPSANAALVNRTIDDADDMFSYSPAANWQAPNNLSCSACLPLPNYQDTYNATLHYAIHAIPRQDADDLHPSSQQPSTGGEAPVTAPASQASASQSLAPPASAPASPATSSQPAPSSASSPTPSPAAPPSTLSSSSLPQALQQAAATPATVDSHDGGGGGKHGGGSDISTRGLSIFPRTDADDPNFKDINLTATLSFTGTACYVYCAVPVQSSNSSLLSLTNLTFFIDNSMVGQFHHDPSKDTGSSLGYQYQVMVFFKDDLPYAPHILVIKPALGSVLLLDFVQYTTLDTASPTDSNGSMAQATPSGVLNSSDSENYSNKNNSATFGAAIGSTLGVLTLISLAVFINIWRRRRRSAQREKYREALESAIRPESPEMRGPQPFIPRYFPGVAPLPASTSPPPFSPLSTASSRHSEPGPSHGLEFPLAPGHLDAPEYSSVPLVLPNPPSRVPISLPPVSRRVSNGDSDLPPYQDVGQTQLVSTPSIPVSIPAPIPASMRPPSLSSSLERSSPSSSSQTGGGETPPSSLSLLLDRPDFHQREGAAGDTIPSIHVNPDGRPG